jgi:hypothetical protein
MSQVTNVWISADGDEVAIRFDDDTYAIESRGGSRSADLDSVADWRMVAALSGGADSSAVSS